MVYLESSIIIQKLSLKLMRRFESAIFAAKRFLDFAQPNSQVDESTHVNVLLFVFMHKQVRSVISNNFPVRFCQNWMEFVHAICIILDYKSFVG